MNFPHRGRRTIALILGVLATSTVVATIPAAAEAAKDLCSVPYVRVLPKKAAQNSNVRIFAVIECPKKTGIVMKVNVWKTDGTKDQLASTSYTVTAEVPLVITSNLPAPASMESICANTFQGSDKLNGICAPARA